MTKIIIVEDRPDIVRGISRAIDRDMELSVLTTYNNAEDALEGIPTHVPDIVLLDIGLPKMSGIECMVRLREQQTQVKFLMFTVFDADEQLFNALKFGASGYILKSDGIIGVIKAIKELQQGGAPMSRTIAKKVLQSFRKKNTPTPLEVLTPKQNEVLHLLSDGLFNKEIADRLNISEGTIKQHLHQIYQKLHVNNRVEARNKYLQGGQN